MNNVKNAIEINDKWVLINDGIATAEHDGQRFFTDLGKAGTEITWKKRRASGGGRKKTLPDGRKYSFERTTVQISRDFLKIINKRKGDLTIEEFLRKNLDI